MPEYSEHVETLRTWLKATGSSMLSDPDARGWCVFEVNSFVSEDVNEYFNTEQPNEDFQKEADKDELTNLPVSQYQIENDHIFATGRMLIYRHQPRLKYYRDDIENKIVRTPSSLALSLGKLNLLKEVMKA